MKPRLTTLELPLPDAIARAHSERVESLIRGEIAANGGRISFARYMELALYAPGLGYYSAGARKFGADGDFVTAPEISPLFAHCVARQCEQVLRALGQADILEVGAGSGIMAGDILRALEQQDCLPKYYYILEVSAELRERQYATLKREIPALLGRVSWLDTLPSSGWRGVIVANELLDAMPVHRFQIKQNGVRELCVAGQDNKFVWQDAALTDPALTACIEAIEKDLSDHGAGLAPGYESEINLAATAWIHSIAAILEAGLLLIVDYGYPRHEYYYAQRSSGTLMCHYRHRAHADPLILPGLQDITAHIDFTALAEAADAAGLAVAGYTTQAAFLLACGIAELAAELDSEDIRARVTRAQQIKKLTLPSEMGELFKVIALTRTIDMPLLGFNLQDLRGRL